MDPYLTATSQQYVARTDGYKRLWILLRMSQDRTSCQTGAPPVRKERRLSERHFVSSRSLGQGLDAGSQSALGIKSHEAPI